MPSSALVVADMERVVPGAGPTDQHRAALQMALEKISLMALGDTERAVLYGDVVVGGGGVGITDDGSCESDHSGDNLGSSNGNNNNGGGGSGGGASNGNNGCGGGVGVNNNSNSSRRGGNTTECVCVPSSEHVAEIVGRQGCKIKALRAKTNTYIKTPVRGEEPVFVITGRPEDVCMAKQEILSAAEHFSVLRAFRNKPPGPALGPGPNPQSLATAAGGGGAAPGGAVGPAQLQPPPAVPGQTTIQVRVPYRVVGLVVGPKGATIRRIQQATHTYIVTPSREREPVFEVTGLPHNVERAREEIESHIAARTGSLLEFCGGAGGVDGESDFHVNGMDVGFEYSGAGGGGGGGYQPGSLWLRLPRKPLFAAPSRNDSSSSLGSVSSDSRVGGAAGFGLVDAAEGAAAAAAAALGSRADEPGLWAQLERANPIAAALGGLPHHPGRERAASASGCGSSSSAAPSASSASSGGAEHHPSARRVRSDPLQAMVAHGLPGFLSAEWSLGLLRRGGPGAPASPGEQQQQQQQGQQQGQQQPRECAVCRESAVTAALVPCGHKLFCMECASGICHENDPKCPVCLTSVTQAIRIFS